MALAPARLSPLALILATALLLASACSGSQTSEPATFEPGAVPTVETVDPYHVGKPLPRPDIGDVECVFARYATSRAELIDLFEAQPWFRDGLTRDEALFAERSLSFVARYSGPRVAYIGDETVVNKLYRYEKVPLSAGELEVLLIYEPGQNAEREMAIIRAVLPQLEALVGVPFPEKVMTVVNGAFEVNDFNDGQFIRIARCCTVNEFILAHELAHTYWHIGPSWFNEGMADLYAVEVAQQIDADPPDVWQRTGLDLESFVAARRDTVGRLPNLRLPERFTADGLYPAADVFLYEIREAIGADDFRAAVREVYLASDYSRYRLAEARIQEILMKHAGDRAGTVADLFNEAIWGDDGERYRRYLERTSP